MIFSSLIFVFLFLPVVVLFYYVSDEKYKNAILLVFSLAFYAYGEPKFVFVMVFSIVANYTAARLVETAVNQGRKSRARFFLIADIVLNLAVLFEFKYASLFNSLVSRIFNSEFSLRVYHLPIGISFFTFQALSYVIDVYKKKVSVQKNVLNLALYISFFPQLVAGPIVRYQAIENQIEKRICSIEKFGRGAMRFFLGFSKKVILANNLALVAKEAFSTGDVACANPLFLWLGAICFSLQIFYDFSGYSDMAIGLAELFGFTFEENFNYPYISKSITEFWRRWHISLSQWFRDYVYIPLGGSRCSLLRQILNLFVVWSLTGLWHGAGLHFIAWGLGFFIMLCLERYVVKPSERNRIFRISWQALSMFYIIFSWVLFNAHSCRFGAKYCLSMAGFYKNAWEIDGTIIRCLRDYGVFIVGGIVFATPMAKILSRKIRPSVKNAVFPIGCTFLFLWSVSFILLGSHNPFIYFNF